MFNSRTIRLLTLVCSLTLMFSVTRAQEKKRVNLGFFEGGRCLAHDILRDEFSHQLEQLVPADVEIVPIPQGYMSAGWKRDSCRILARALVRLEVVDIVVAIGNTAYPIGKMETGIEPLRGIGRGNLLGQHVT